MFRTDNPAASNPAGPADAAANPFRGADSAALSQRVAALDKAGRGQATQQAEILGSVGAGLAAMPYPQRRTVLDHMMPVLAARGLPPAAVAAFDPTDANLAAAVAQASALGDLLRQ